MDFTIVKHKQKLHVVNILLVMIKTNKQKLLLSSPGCVCSTYYQEVYYLLIFFLNFFGDGLYGGAKKAPHFFKRFHVSNYKYIST